MKRILIDADKCVGCKNCSLACMQYHRPDSTLYDLNLRDVTLESRNSILIGTKHDYVPIVCRHCDKPECVTACMSGAMEKNPESGYVRYDVEKCGQCFMCVMNCAYGVIKPDRATGTYVVKCDFCLEHDEEPNCAKMCPTKALYVEEV